MDSLLDKAFENPSLERRVVNLLRAWAVAAQFVHPTMALDDLWKSEFVTRFATFFLAFRVRLIPHYSILVSYSLYNFSS